jgi:hypothetical protein
VTEDQAVAKPRSRRLYAYWPVALGIAALAAIAAILYPWAFREGPRHVRHWEAVTIGMTRDEVEARLGEAMHKTLPLEFEETGNRSPVALSMVAGLAGMFGASLLEKWYYFVPSPEEQEFLDRVKGLQGRPKEEVRAFLENLTEEEAALGQKLFSRAMLPGDQKDAYVVVFDTKGRVAEKHRPTAESGD